jgi:hypothetical protein
MTCLAPCGSSLSHSAKALRTFKQFLAIVFLVDDQAVIGWRTAQTSGSYERSVPPFGLLMAVVPLSLTALTEAKISVAIGWRSHAAFSTY